MNASSLYLLTMRPRQDIIQLFSTFAQFDGDRVSRWVEDVRLRRHMQRCLEQTDSGKTGSASEAGWGRYWHQRWLQEAKPTNQQPQGYSLSLGHLSAYLQEPCYWAAAQTVRKFTSIQYSLADYFQIAIADVRTVLMGFNPDRGANLKTFASIAFPRLLRDNLRQRQEINLCTNLGLLRRISKKRLLEALMQAGLSASETAQYQLAWVCFNALYVPSQSGSGQLLTVDQTLWAAIADLYNTERRLRLETEAPEGQPETIERWLNQCAGWVRAYLYPAVESLNVPKAGSEAGRERQDDVAAPLQESLLAELIAQEDDRERQDQRSNLRSEIVVALDSLAPQSQEMLRLYYQQGQTQKQIMQHLQMSQATVSRRLTKAREALLLALVQWSQVQMNSAPSPSLIKEMSAALEEWLEVYYGVPDPPSGSQPAGKEIA